MRGRRILLVEDDAYDEELIRMALGSFRLRNELVVVRDGAAALVHLFGSGEPRRLVTGCIPDLVLLHVARPTAGGTELVEQLRANAHTALVPVVVISDSSDPEDLLASYRAGANSFVRKPAGFQGFTESVRAMCVYWLLMNQPARIQGLAGIS